MSNGIFRLHFCHATSFVNFQYEKHSILTIASFYSSFSVITRSLFMTLHHFMFMFVFGGGLFSSISVDRYISIGSWFIGLDVNHVDEGKFCCSSRSSGAICASG